MLDMDIDDDSPVNVDTVPEPHSTMVNCEEQGGTPSPVRSQPPSRDASTYPASPNPSIASHVLLDFDETLDFNLDVASPVDLDLVPDPETGMNMVVSPERPRSPTLYPFQLPARDASISPPSPCQDSVMDYSMSVKNTAPLPAPALDMPDVSAAVDGNLGAPNSISTFAADKPPIDDPVGEKDTQALEPSGNIRTRRQGRTEGDATTMSCPPTVPSKHINVDTVTSNSASSKRPRTSSKHSLGSTLKTAEMPQWFINSRDMFVSENLGEEWTCLVHEWGRFEEEEDFVELRRLPSKGRPKAVEMWISRARSTSWRTDIGNLKEYKEHFYRWWTLLQPAWRVSNGTIDYNSVVGDWGCLRLPGLNGLQSVLAALFYWGIVVQKKAAQRKVWLSAIEDCFIAVSNLRR